MTDGKFPRHVTPTTGEGWRRLGFYHELDLRDRVWRLVGSQSKLARLASALSEVAASLSPGEEQGTIHLGPYQDLQIKLWERPGIDDESIHGSVDDLRRLGRLIDQKLAGALPGSRVCIGAEYATDLEYSLVFEVMNADFDPASAVPVSVDEPALPSIRSTLLPSIPFKLHDPDAVMTECEGLIRLEDSFVVLEHQTKDAFIGAFKSKVREAAIPFDAIASIHFKRGLFGAEIAMQARDMMTFEDIPTSGIGRIRLKFKRSDRDGAERLANALQVLLGG